MASEAEIRFKRDTIGHMYEDAISPDVRHDLGQYYTPPEIVELITRLTIEDPDDVILDPSCGTGVFLTTAYNILKGLKEETANLPNMPIFWVKSTGQVGRGRNQPLRPPVRREDKRIDGGGSLPSSARGQMMQKGKRIN